MRSSTIIGPLVHLIFKYKAVLKGFRRCHKWPANPGGASPDLIWAALCRGARNSLCEHGIESARHLVEPASNLIKKKWCLPLSSQDNVETKCLRTLAIEPRIANRKEPTSSGDVRDASQYGIAQGLSFIAKEYCGDQSAHDT